MKTIRVKITAEELEAKRISEILERAFEDEGNPVTIYEDSSDGKIWSAEILLFSMEPDEAAALVRDRVGADAFAAPLEAEELPDINWVEKSLEGLKPVRAGRFFVHGSHDRDKVPGGAIGLEIEAALAFGTGHHGTTAGCLEEIDRLLSMREYDSILDLGTGTGVLAIAAALKARQQVLATDNDPIATRTALENARLNGARHLVTGFTANGVEDRRFNLYGPFDLVIANILARPLMKMSKSICARMTPTSTLILSGLRIEDGPRILFAYGCQGFVLDRRREKDGWLTLTLVRGRKHA
ncbi:50S ribosomal protein L11 methyltransferase [Roseibium alexandrii]|uniref:Ribosomal protein L11 methyltransferase n=1 Tax=Roseibium alexandrii (strain DSM 17067 / NCIMB 14079 / DFL-11) TaxID=244592 RepID=A0A5E8GXK4_ROSAD|nr:50S ribosomal protein L11 methyltransferase [Roseibium alexandrii]EEE44373.1 Ribosomal protein L11 methylase [Roseibium alexandrii DFL-11]